MAAPTGASCLERQQRVVQRRNPGFLGRVCLVLRSGNPTSNGRHQSRVVELTDSTPKAGCRDLCWNCRRRCAALSASQASNCSRMSGGRPAKHSVRVPPAAIQSSRGRVHGYSFPSRYLPSPTGACCPRPPGGARLRSAGGCVISGGSGPLSLQPKMPGLLQPAARCNPKHP